MALGLTYWFVVAALLMCGAVCAENGAEGDSCVTNSGEGGVCTSLKKCPTALAALRKGTAPKTCSYNTTTPVVCCPQGRARRSAPAACPPLPPDAVNGQKTGQKAHDKCLELAEYVYPCKPSANPGSPRMRVNTCAWVTNPLITRGNEVEPGEYPHMAALGFGEQNDTQWSCGGTLVSDRWVLTAAHCAFARSLGEVKYVRLGGGERNSTAAAEYIFTIVDIVVHPEFTGSSVYNDIALLMLDRPVTFSSLVRPACLHTGPPGEEIRAVATGWGATQSRGEMSNSLHKITLDIFSQEECSPKIPPSRKLKDGLREATQLCAGPKTGHADTCQGDAGGPLQVFNHKVYCTHLVIGLTSFGKACGITGQPSVYTRVAAFIPWIENVVWPDAEPSPQNNSSHTKL